MVEGRWSGFPVMAARSIFAGMRNRRSAIMRARSVFYSVSLIAGLAAPAAFAEPPAAPRPRATTRRVVMARGASYLGVGVVEIVPERAKELHLKDEHGVEVRGVDPDSPASKAG